MIFQFRVTIKMSQMSLLGVVDSAVIAMQERKGGGDVSC
jgi:hypothetical protein